MLAYRPGQRRDRQAADIEAIVAVNAARVITPMIPILTPAAWTRTAGFTLAHSTARPLAASMRFPARTQTPPPTPGPSAPLLHRRRASERLPPARPGRSRTHGSRLRQRRSRARCTRRPPTPLLSHRLQRPLEHVARVDQQDGAAVSRAGLAQVLQIAAEQRQAAAAVRGRIPPWRSFVPTIDNVATAVGAAARARSPPCLPPRFPPAPDAVRMPATRSTDSAVSVFLTFMCIWKIRRVR